MTVYIADGPLGIEATHQWNDGLILNAPVEDGLPRVKVKRITGHRSQPDVTRTDLQLQGRVGEFPQPPVVGGRTLVYEGFVQGSTLQELRATQAALDAAFGNRYREGRMVIKPHDDYGSPEWAQWSYTAHVLQLDQDDEQLFGPTRQPTPFQRSFILGVRLHDPRIYSWPDALTVPQMVEAPADDGDTVMLDNQGSADALPYFDAYGPFTGDVSVFRGGDDPKELTFKALDIPADHTFRIDFRDQTAKDLTANKDWTGRLDLATSDWWDEGEEGIAPQAVTPVGLTMPGSGGTWRVAYRHASW